MPADGTQDELSRPLCFGYSAPSHLFFGSSSDETITKLNLRRQELTFYTLTYYIAGAIGHPHVHMPLSQRSSPVTGSLSDCYRTSFAPTSTRSIWGGPFGELFSSPAVPASSWGVRRHTASAYEPRRDMSRPENNATAMYYLGLFERWRRRTARMKVTDTLFAHELVPCIEEEGDTSLEVLSQEYKRSDPEGLARVQCAWTQWKSR